jgi:pilus assembly protein CpaC
MARAGYNQGTAKMVQAILRRTALAALALVAVAAADVSLSTAGAQDVATAMAPGAIHRMVKVGLNKSVIVDLPRDARDILVSNPSIADAVIRTARRIYITGVAVGQSNIIVFDRAGNQVAFLDLEVERDTAGLSEMLHRLIPDSDIKVEIISDNIVLSGRVRNASDARQAEDIASIFANGGANSGSGNSPSSSSSSGGGGSSGGTAGINVSVQTSAAGGSAPSSRVINLLAIEGEDQVHLKVTVAEVQRSIAKQLGIEMSGNINVGKFSSCAVSGTCSTTGNPFGVNGDALSDNQLSIGYDDGVSSLSATLKALEQTSMIKTLAEPTLTAISGETASFLAGGEYPVPSGRDESGNVTFEFKPFGVALGFTPVVLSEGRISLRVKTEVSELTTEGSVTISGTTIPGLKVRRADSTLELPSGGALVMGGMLQDSVSQSIAKFPGLGDLPILGPLFRSRDFQRSETELVIIVTPYLVKPVPRSALTTPDTGYSTPGDAQSNFLGDLNRVYGAQGAKAPVGTYQGNYGFIIE